MAAHFDLSRFRLPPHLEAILTSSIPQDVEF